MNMRLLLSSLAASAALCATGPIQQGFAATLNLSTGQDPSGTIYTTGGQIDANWTVDPYGPTDPAGTAETVFPSNADWYGGWLGNDSSSDWIARNANVTDNGPAPYTFFYRFTLANTTGASVSGSWAIDDQGTLNLNGHQIGSLGSGAWGALTPFSDSNTSDFVAGLNTLSITITNDDRFLEAGRLTGTLTGNLGSVPEPSSSLLLSGALGLAALLCSRRSVRIRLFSARSATNR